MFTASPSAGSDMAAVQSLFDLTGVAAFVDRESGRTVVITHGTPEGHLPCLRAEHGFVVGAIVVCCFPKQVKARYPQLEVVGDWACVTTIKSVGGVFAAYPKQVA
jgi:hypothetical protein